MLKINKKNITHVFKVFLKIFKLLIKILIRLWKRENIFRIILFITFMFSQ